MKRLFLSLTTLILLANSLHAQKKPGWNWYFGNHAGVTFKYGSPLPLLNGQLDTYEGVASISDSSGNLLFYTNGLTVYNRSHVTMLNGAGLSGNISSTQSAIIVKQPLSDSLFYIFIVDADENYSGFGFSYSLIDMSLDNGKGKVIIKNQMVRDGAREKVTAVRHRNGLDYWILINDFNDDDIFAYRLTSTGFDTAIVRSNVGPIHDGAGVNTLGYMKASRQDDKIALAVHRKNGFWVFDFDNSVGIASNKIIVNTANTNGKDVYGVEFSPDGKLLYGSIIRPSTVADSSKIFQYNLQAGSTGAIDSSETLIAHHAITSADKYYYSALQLGPDGVIYVSENSNTYLGAINNPNQIGISCNFVNNAVSLGGKTCTYGLPNIVTSESTPTYELLYYRSKQTGNWNDVNTWETSPDSLFTTGIVSPALKTPDWTNAAMVTVRKGDTVTVTIDGSSRDIRVNNQLIVNQGIKFFVNPR